MTAPAPHGGQTNRERAAEVGDALPRGWLSDDDRRRIAHAVIPLIAAAEARGDATGYERGRAEALREAAAKIEELAAKWEHPVRGGHRASVLMSAAPRLRRLAADLSVPGSQEPQP